MRMAPIDLYICMLGSQLMSCLGRTGKYGLVRVDVFLLEKVCRFEVS